MLFLPIKLTDDICSNGGLNNLLRAIDKRIYTIAYTELNNIRYGFNHHVDYTTYNQLLVYKEILIYKLLGCNCLEDTSLLNIIHNIKKLLR